MWNIQTALIKSDGKYQKKFYYCKALNVKDCNLKWL